MINTNHNSAEPLVSVFTPVYNSDKYLKECIESVLNQTYTNWEYLIINNCSTDKTLEIAREYADKEPRIRIHDNAEFLNQMQNWNHGLRLLAPESKYCKVVHGDDWLYPECIEKMVAVAETSSNIGIVSSYRLDETNVNLCGLPPGEISFSGKEVCRQYLMNKLHVFGSPSTLLIRSDIIRKDDPFYDEKNVHSDTDACLRILTDYDLGFVHQVLSYTRRHNESSTSFANKFHTRTIDRVKTFTTYGPCYLTPSEYKKNEKLMSKFYHRFLARQLFMMTGQEFWKYQQNELRKVGISVSRPKLVAAILAQLTHPRDTYRLLRDSLRNKQDNKPDSSQRDVLSRLYTDE